MLNLSAIEPHMQFCDSTEKQTIYFINGDNFWRITTVSWNIMHYDSVNSGRSIRYSVCLAYNMPKAWEPV